MGNSQSYDVTNVHRRDSGHLGETTGTVKPLGYGTCPGLGAGEVGIGIPDDADNDDDDDVHVVRCFWLTEGVAQRNIFIPKDSEISHEKQENKSPKSSSGHRESSATKQPQKEGENTTEFHKQPTVCAEENEALSDVAHGMTEIALEVGGVGNRERNL
ncbi:unnamed protein product [Angiostrongylus costaricensis]|uniref:Uncharacterized protein n=1 Tax=Angiostrongylus costaricensis TaxID=334426 RepID=A0A0R3PN50_ANGCS|nr:unnamed protein product [Angiostrongylus costaricensis]